MYLIGTVTFSWTLMTIKFLLIIRIIRHCNIKIVLYTYVFRFQYGFRIALLQLCNNTWVISNISTHIFYESIIENIILYMGISNGKFILALTKFPCHSTLLVFPLM